MRDRLVQGWLVLLSLSAISAGLTTEAVSTLGFVPGLVLLALAFAKAYIILSDYLGLSRSVAWRRGFAAVVGLFLLGIAGLYVAASG